MSNPTPEELRLFVPEALLSRLQGDSSLMKEVLDACVPDLARNVQSFERSLRAGEVKDAQRVVHSLRGSAKNADLPALAAMAKEIGEALAEDAGVSQSQLDRLSKMVSDSTRAIEGYFSGI